MIFGGVRCVGEFISSVDFPRFQRVLESLHINSVSVELHAFQFQARSLLAGCRAMQFDLAARSQHAVPWELIDRTGA